MTAPPAERVYRVRHHYRYVYTAPVTAVKQRLIMIPPDRHVEQALVSFDFDVRGTTGRLDIRWDTDQFGNRVCHVEAERVEHALDFEARFSVRRDDSAAGAYGRVGPDLRRTYLAVTALTAAEARVASAAQTIAKQASSLRQRADLAHDWAASSITYQLGVTGTQTPAAMALHLGQGVCQDYAHIMLSLLRKLDVPARYVSGHLLGDGAPHAWVEVLLDDDRILAYDPTHHRLALNGYIVVAVGRDFADVTPTSGLFSGAATGKLHWSKQAVLEDGVADAAA